MSSKSFDPQKFIDREFEQELFEDLLQFADAARLLAIRDGGGMGKSHLLGHFQYRCRTVRPRTPVSLVALDQLSDDSPPALIRQIVKDLTAIGVAFPQFNRIESARVSGDFMAIRASAYLHSGRGPSDGPPERRYRTVLRQTLAAHFDAGELRTLCFDLGVEYEDLPDQGKGNKARELIALFERQSRLPELIALGRRLRPEVAWDDLVDTPTPLPRPSPHLLAELTDEQQSVAQEASIRAFFDDLHAYCATAPMVLMLDAYEKCAADLQSWIIEHFCEQLCFAPHQRPARLILVVAGREIPAFTSHWAAEECAAVVRSVDGLGKWSRDHVEECLRVHGFAHEAGDLDAFHRLIEMGIPPSQVIQVIQTALINRGRAA